MATPRKYLRASERAAREGAAGCAVGGSAFELLVCAHADDGGRDGAGLGRPVVGQKRGRDNRVLPLRRRRRGSALDALGNCVLGAGHRGRDVLDHHRRAVAGLVTSQSIQAAHVIASVGREFDEVIQRLFPTEIGRGPSQVETPTLSACEDTALEARGSGYVQSVDADSLMKLACERGLLVELSFRPGDMVMPGDVLARVWPVDSEGKADEDAIAKKMNGCFAYGVQRTALQDALFPIDQLAEIAARPLSLGINDPFTAMSCLDRLGLALSKLARRELPSGLRLDESGQPRVRTRALRFEDAAAHALDPIRHYGSDAPLVVNRLLLILERLAPHLKREADRETLRRHAELTIKAARENIASRAEREGVEESYRKTARALASTSTC